MPRLATDEHTDGMDALTPEAEALFRTARRGMDKMTTAAASRTLLQALGMGMGGDSSGGSSGMAKTLGEVFGSLGTSVKGLTEAQSAVMQMALGAQKSGEGGMAGMMPMILILLTMQQQDSQRWQNLLENDRNHWSSRVADLEHRLEERSAPSPWDQMATTSLQTIFSGLLAEAQDRRKPQTLKEQVADLREAMDGVPELFGRQRGTEYTEGYLRNRELDVKEKEIVGQTDLKRQQTLTSRAWAKAALTQGPQVMAQLISPVYDVLLSLGVLHADPRVVAEGPPAPGPQDPAGAADRLSRARERVAAGQGAA